MLNAWNNYRFAGLDMYICFFCEIYNEKEKKIKTAVPMYVLFPIINGDNASKFASPPSRQVLALMTS